MKTINDHKYSQRAVAPIIATLLMVAISVVGGILIFVFAQGFFTDTNIAAPSIESLHIFGYDASNNVNLRPHNFDLASGVAAGSTIYGPQIANVANTGTDIGKLIDADHILLYVRNTGNSPVVISTIRVFATTYSPVSGAACTTTLPAVQTFSVSGDGTLGRCTDQPIVPAGSDVTVYIGYEDADNGKIKIGRPLPVTIVTANGATFSKHLQLGLQIGG